MGRIILPAGGRAARRSGRAAETIQMRHLRFHCQLPIFSICLVILDDLPPAFTQILKNIVVFEFTKCQV